MARDQEDPEAIKAVFRRARREEEQRREEPPPAGGPRKPVDRVHLVGLSPRAYEHPADRAALTALRRVPGFDQVLRKMFGAFSERGLKLLFLANSVRVSDRQFKRVYGAWRDCCDILDVERRPELYVAQRPVVNAGAIGVDEPFIVLYSGLLDLLDDDELRFVLGHELGHVLSGHALYKTMLRILLMITLPRSPIPIAGVAVWGLLMALKEWDRKSELSGDRAGLLCLQDPQVAYRVHMKMAGGNRVDEMDVDAFVEQAAEYERSGDLRDSALKLLHMLGATHPFAVVRLAELKRWVESGEYEKVLRGDYPRRRDDQQVSIYDDVAAGAQAYRDALAKSNDPLARFFQDLASALGEAGSAVRDQIRDVFNRGDKNGGDQNGGDPPPPDGEDEPKA